ncbi:MAG: NUDIX domain-containing protein [Comamonadaceae bacterium]|nr:NUDIX domain-containing protein [Comamonadaceae bacterium]
MRRLWALAESLVPRADVERVHAGPHGPGCHRVHCARTPACGRCPLRAALRGAARRARRRAARRARPPQPRRVRGGPHARRSSRADEVLVEKRPAAGIWGGLWSLPEAPADAEPAARVARPSRAARGRGRGAASRSAHAFTHFTLAVTPWLRAA